MPYTTSSNHKNCDPINRLPQHLDHKPIYALPYEKFDGDNSKLTDVRYISIGIAQYDPDQISMKMMRHTGEKWTRQAEELPPHRIIDMTLFLAKALFAEKDHTIKIEKGTFHNQSDNIGDIFITQEKRNYGEIETYKVFLKNNVSLYKERLNKLFETLKQLKQDGKI